MMFLKNKKNFITFLIILEGKNNIYTSTFHPLIVNHKFVNDQLRVCDGINSEVYLLVGQISVSFDIKIAGLSSTNRIYICLPLYD